jgi:hypothetical protein
MVSRVMLSCTKGILKKSAMLVRGRLLRPQLQLESLSVSLICRRRCLVKTSSNMTSQCATLPLAGSAGVSLKRVLLQFCGRDASYTFLSIDICAQKAVEFLLIKGRISYKLQATLN